MTAGIDVQDDRIDVEVIGWRAAKRDEPEESWGIEDRVFYGSKKDQDGRTLRIGGACIDSAGHRTDEIYRFCNARLGRHIYAVVGRDGPRPIWPRCADKKKYRDSLVWTVGMDSAKEVVYSSLRVLNHGPGYAHFPIA